MTKFNIKIDHGNCRKLRCENISKLPTKFKC